MAVSEPKKLRSRWKMPYYGEGGIPRVRSFSETDELKRKQQKEKQEFKKQEIEDNVDVLDLKCTQLAQALVNSAHVIVYTGAGVSTSANIPDYRGKDGVWTNIIKGNTVKMENNITHATPTYTHMCIAAMVRCGLVKHVVSQNCDGLHLRSGLNPTNLSEIHGNMYIEVCKECSETLCRTFDVTQKTSLRRHDTGRKCPKCGGILRDSIVHFGEKSNLRWPHNWIGATDSAEKADIILCLGSSLKVLRHYKDLWLMSRPKKKRPALFIVNLQWTPKDSQSTLKINGKVDEVMTKVANILNIPVSTYSKDKDLALCMAVPLREEELNKTLPHIPQSMQEDVGLNQATLSSQIACSSSTPSWFGKGLRKPLKTKRKRGRKVVKKS